MLERQHRSTLDEACELRINNPHLTQTECLQVAGLPLACNPRSGKKSAPPAVLNGAAIAGGGAVGQAGR